MQDLLDVACGDRIRVDFTRFDEFQIRTMLVAVEFGSLVEVLRFSCVGEGGELEEYACSCSATR